MLKRELVLEAPKVAFTSKESPPISSFSE